MLTLPKEAPRRAVPSTEQPTERPGQPATPDLERPRTISPDDLHAHLVRMHRLGNRIRREFLECLLVLHERKLYHALGFSSTFHYAAHTFGIERSETYDSLRVARALKGLPRSLEAFDRGKLSWSALKEVSRVATRESEAEWLACAQEQPVRRLQAEVGEALRQGRTRPRDAGERGLPVPRMRFQIDLAPEEHEVLDRALRKVAAEIDRRAGAPDGLEPREALLFMARAFLQSDPAETPRGRVEREDPLYTILYHQCPRCRASTLEGREGPVAVDPDVVDRVKGEAREVEIRPDEEGEDSPRKGEENPTTATLRRKVLLRDGAVCANPRCGHRLGLQAHHIEFRSRGGKTKLSNELAVCRLCHAAIHAGLLRVEGNAFDGLRFVPRGDEVEVPGLGKDLEFLASLGVGSLDVGGLDPGGDDVSGRPDTTRPGAVSGAGKNDVSGRPDRTRPAALPTTRDLETLARGLGRLGYPRGEALARLRAAEEELAVESRAPSVEELIRRALRARV